MKPSRSSKLTTVPEVDSFSPVEKRLAITQQRMPGYPVEYAAVIRLTRHLDKRIHDLGNAALLPFGVNMVTYNTLMVLHGSEDNRVLASELAASSGEKRANITRICDELVAKQLIARVTGTSDRRSVVVSLTVAGQQLLESLQSTMTRLMQMLYRDVSQEELRTLQRLLRRQLSNLDRCTFPTRT